MHYSLSKQILESGKSVLCEKPICVNSSELNSLIEIARQNNQFLMEGLWTRFNPSIGKILSLINDNAIGEIQGELYNSWNEAEHNGILEIFKLIKE